jgi:phage shock protein PspC (stress-responsive transcriptional regulator)
VDVGGVRLLFIFLTIFVGGGIIAYLLIYLFLMPRK